MTLTAVAMSTVAIVSSPANALAPDEDGPQQRAITEFCTQPFALEGMSCFYSTGDKVKVMDISRDGLRAVAEIVVDGGARRECHDANGADNGW